METTTIIILIGAIVPTAAILMGAGALFTKLAGRVKDNTKRIDVLSLWISRIEKYAHTRSPVSLTDDGVTLLKESGAEGYIEKNKENLLKQFKRITEPYDIQRKAGEVMFEELVNDKNIKDFVFRKGKNMLDVAGVAGIALRDAVLKEKGIDIEQYKDKD